MIPAPGILLALGGDGHIKDDIATCGKCQKYEFSFRIQRQGAYPKLRNHGRLQEGGNHWTKVWKIIWSLSAEENRTNG